MIGDNGNVSWCLIWCAANESDPRMTSGIATREIAESMAGEVRRVGDQVVLIAEAGELAAFAGYSSAIDRLIAVRRMIN